jgi:hypothetical protein
MMLLTWFTVLSAIILVAAVVSCADLFEETVGPVHRWANITSVEDMFGGKLYHLNSMHTLEEINTATALKGDRFMRQ